MKHPSGTGKDDRCVHDVTGQVPRYAEGTHVPMYPCSLIDPYPRFAELAPHPTHRAPSTHCQTLTQMRIALSPFAEGTPQSVIGDLGLEAGENNFWVPQLSPLL